MTQETVLCGLAGLRSAPRSGGPHIVVGVASARVIRRLMDAHGLFRRPGIALPTCEPVPCCPHGTQVIMELSGEYPEGLLVRA